MRIATFNINGVNTRLANLLAWLEDARPDVACLQELKAATEQFPAKAIHAAGYDASRSSLVGACRATRPTA